MYQYESKDDPVAKFNSQKFSYVKKERERIHACERASEGDRKRERERKGQRERARERKRERERESARARARARAR